MKIDYETKYELGDKLFFVDETFVNNDLCLEIEEVFVTKVELSVSEYLLYKEVKNPVEVIYSVSKDKDSSFNSKTFYEINGKLTWYSGNYFKTREEAEQYITERKLIFAETYGDK